jgi:hypothetical protein
MEDPTTMEDPAVDWELVCETPGQDVTDRLRVDAGYLYRSTWFAGATTKNAGQVAVALAFVPATAPPKGELDEGKQEPIG